MQPFVDLDPRPNRISVSNNKHTHTRNKKHMRMRKGFFSWPRAWEFMQCWKYMQLPFALHKKIGSVCLHSKMWIDLSNRSTSAVRKLGHGVSGIPQENNMTVEKKSKWQKIETKSYTFSAFVVHYRQSRLEISSRGTLQLFAAWELPVIPVQNLRCRWNVPCKVWSDFEAQS